MVDLKKICSSELRIRRERVIQMREHDINSYETIRLKSQNDSRLSLLSKRISDFGDAISEIEDELNSRGVHL